MTEKSGGEKQLSKVESIWHQKEVQVCTFDEFVKEIRQLLPEFQMEQGTYYWFRGQSNYKWGLTHSFMRITSGLGLRPKDAIDLERAARNEFKSKAHLYVNASLLDKVKTNPCWWAVMQHHGAPTRLLDWSISPYVAAYFASQQDGSSNDGAVWCFCSGHLKDSFEKKYNCTLPDFTKTEEQDDKVKKFHDQLQNPGATGGVAPLTFPFVSSERIAKQQGRFTVCLGIYQKHDCISEQVGPDYVKRIRIPHKSKPEFLVQLRLVNITASAMFPGVDGLGRSVAELASLGAMYKSVCDLRSGEL